MIDASGEEVALTNDWQGTEVRERNVKGIEDEIRCLLWPHLVASG